MLKKKLSKLIVGILTAMLLSVGVGNVGNFVYASSVNESVSTRALTMEINQSTSESDIISYIQNGTLTLKVNGNVKLTQKIADAINRKDESVTFDISSSSSLVINENISVKSGKIIISRGRSKTGSLLEIDKQVEGVSRRSIEVSGILFDNNEIDDSVFTNNDLYTDVILRENILFGGGRLSSNDNKNTTYVNNVINDGLIDNNNVLSFTNNKVDFCVESLTVSGKLLINNEKVVSPRIIVYDVNGEQVGEDLPVAINDDGTFSGTGFEGELTPGAKYTADIEFEDKDGNIYTRELGRGETYKFSIKTSNITNNSADVILDFGNIPSSKYGLEFMIFVDKKIVNQYRIDYSQKEELTVFKLEGLRPGTDYVTVIRDKDGHVIVSEMFRTTGSSIVGGGIGNVGSTISLDVTSSDINKATITDISATIPVGSTTLVNYLRGARDLTVNLEGVGVSFADDKLEFRGLVPEKEYKNVVLTYIDRNSVKRIARVSTFKTKSGSNKLRQFIIDVYKQSLNRLPDEKGFAFWERELKNKIILPSTMVKNLLNEKEFLAQNLTVQSKIESLYKVIVNRNSDAQGLEFWKNKYEEMIKSGQNDLMALDNVSNEMVSEKEFKDRVTELGI